jgi:hypothetical protein
MVRFSSEHGEDLSFSVLTTQTFRRSPPSSSHENGIQRRANGKTAEKASGDAINGRSGSGFPLRGNDGKWDCVYTPTLKNRCKPLAGSARLFRHTISLSAGLILKGRVVIWTDLPFRPQLAERVESRPNKSKTQRLEPQPRQSGDWRSQEGVFFLGDDLQDLAKDLQIVQTLPPTCRRLLHPFARGSIE